MFGCYTQAFGKLTVVAKGSLRMTSKQGMNLDMLTLVNFELVHGRATPIITGAQQEKTYRQLKESLPALSIASFFLEALDKIVFDLQPDQRLWDFYIQLFDQLDNQPHLASREFFRAQQAELLKILGYTPHATPSPYGLSPMDVVFEETAQRQFNSLKFIYSVLQ